MRSSWLRRLHGLSFTGLLLFQGAVMPLSACASSHADDSGGMAHARMADGASEHRSDAPEELPDPMPADCGALSGCGVPVLNADRGPGLITFALRAPRVEGPLSEGPDAVDLGIITPPPRI